MAEKVIVQGGLEGKRSRGRPAMRWTDDIKRRTRLVETPVTAMAEKRRNREECGGREAGADQQ